MVEALRLVHFRGYNLLCSQCFWLTVPFATSLQITQVATYIFPDKCCRSFLDGAYYFATAIWIISAIYNMFASQPTLRLNAHKIALYIYIPPSSLIWGVIYHLYSYLYFSFANVSDQATASPKILWDAQSLTKNVCSDDWPGVHDWLCVCVCVCVCVWGILQLKALFGWCVWKGHYSDIECHLCRTLDYAPLPQFPASCATRAELQISCNIHIYAGVHVPHAHANIEHHAHPESAASTSVLCGCFAQSACSHSLWWSPWQLTWRRGCKQMKFSLFSPFFSLLPIPSQVNCTMIQTWLDGRAALQIHGGLWKDKEFVAYRNKLRAACRVEG